METKSKFIYVLALFVWGLLAIDTSAAVWHVRGSESSSISITSGGVVTVAAGATSGARLTARAADSNGNYEFWVIKVA